jgi:hypothetical protein
MSEIKTDNLENEDIRWFYQGELKNNKIVWNEYDKDTCEVIECKYKDYLENQDDTDFQFYEIEEIG